MTIEQRLQTCAAGDSRHSLLLAQWTFDKALLGRSLNSVSTGFPHYSLHDATHSETILREIEKIRGAHTEVLSAVDCWLLLEAAYWHDLGMVLAYSERNELIESDEFALILRQLREEPGDLPSTHAGLPILWRRATPPIVPHFSMRNVAFALS